MQRMPGALSRLRTARPADASTAHTLLLVTGRAPDTELGEDLLHPWALLDMRYLLDLHSEVDRIVRSNPWWEKLEFQLSVDQNKLGGFRTYLGEQLFNSKSRFITYATAVPCCLLLMVVTLHLRYVLRHRRVACDAFALLPHCTFALGLGLVANLAAAQLAGASGLMACVNLCMYAVEAQVNKDWSAVMGVEEVEEPSLFWNRPSLCREVNSIPVLWQVLTCQQSLRSIASGFWDDIVQNRQRHGMRRPSMVVQTWF